MQTVLADFRTISIDQLRESPTNPRRTFDAEKLQDLAQSIRAQVVLVPLIVRSVGPDEYEVIAGARRLRAAEAAELFAVPVRVVELSDAEALTLQLIENAQREDVHPLEEAHAYRKLLDMAEPKYDVASLALKIGKSAAHLYARLRYVDLIKDAAQAFLENRLTAGHATSDCAVAVDAAVAGTRSRFPAPLGINREAGDPGPRTVTVDSPKSDASPGSCHLRSRRCNARTGRWMLPPVFEANRIQHSSV